MKVERSQLHFLAVTCTGEICKRSCNYCTCTQWNASTAYKLAISAAFLPAFSGLLRSFIRLLTATTPPTEIVMRRTKRRHRRRRWARQSRMLRDNAMTIAAWCHPGVVAWQALCEIPYVNDGWADSSSISSISNSVKLFICPSRLSNACLSV